LTNWHNVTGKNSDTEQLLDKQGRLPDEIKIVHLEQLPGKALGWVERFEELYDDHQKALWHEHPKHGRLVDAVALPLTELAEVRLLPYVGRGAPSWPTITWGPADIVSVVGFPFGMTGGGSLAIWATGFVASEPQVDMRDLPLFLIDCRARPGQSGSAVVVFRNGGTVITEDGSISVGTGSACRFLGLYSGRINSESDLGLVWKESALLDILATLP